MKNQVKLHIEASLFIFVYLQWELQTFKGFGFVKLESRIAKAIFIVLSKWPKFIIVLGQIIKEKITVSTLLLRINCCYLPQHVWKIFEMDILKLFQTLKTGFRPVAIYDCR